MDRPTSPVREAPGILQLVAALAQHALRLAAVTSKAIQTGEPQTFTMNVSGSARSFTITASESTGKEVPHG
jgi:hypothetical protein